LKLSVIIVSYRVRDQLKSCLHSIYENGFPDTIEVIVIDNASGDRTVETLSGLFPVVLWIENDENIGFAPAVNQAADRASGELLLLLNPDTSLVPGALANLVQFMEDRPKIGAVGPCMMLLNGKSYVSVMPFLSCMSVFFYETRLNRIFPFCRFIRPYTRLLKENKPFMVDSVEGSLMLLRRKAWEAVGGFDSHYFFGLEEMDLAWQLRCIGLEIWFHPFPAAFHQHSGSIGGKRRGVIRLSVTLAPLYFLRKNRRKSYEFLTLPLLVIYSVKWASSYLLGWIDNAMTFKEAVKALLGLRPLWVTQNDRSRWSDN